MGLNVSGAEYRRGLSSGIRSERAAILAMVRERAKRIRGDDQARLLEQLAADIERRGIGCGGEGA